MVEHVPIYVVVMALVLDLDHVIVIQDGFLEIALIVSELIIYILGTCPYDHPYNDPTSDTDPSDRIDLECSGQGNCNRESGLCECFPGYEGTACQRTSCPNMCSGHGVCTAVDKLTLNEQNHENIYYEKDTTVKYVHWDDDQSYACVCDKEYTGYDCSKSI